MRSPQRGALTQQASERDGRRERGEVDEDDGGHALAVEGVLKVADVVRVAPPHVSDQAAEGPAGALQGVIGLLERRDKGFCVVRRAGRLR